MNSLTFRERFKDKLGVILKNGTFNIKESSAVVKKQLPQEKFHPIHKSQSINFKALDKKTEYCYSRKLTESSSYNNQSYFQYAQPQKMGITGKLIETTFNSRIVNKKLSELTLRNHKNKKILVNKLPILKPKFRNLSIAKMSSESCLKYSNSMQKHN